METIKLQATIDEDGVLKVEIPTGLSPQTIEVVMVLQPNTPAQAAPQQPQQEENWEDFVNRMYGALADDPIERPSQLPLEVRDPIE